MTPTQSCQKLFYRALVKAMKPYGHTLRYNHPIDPYFADIYIHPYWVVEVDGPEHNHSPKYELDKERTLYLEERGKIVIRVTNVEVINAMDETIQRVIAVVCPQTPLSPGLRRKLVNFSNGRFIA
jgi:very-short-patch-repair endonuclease